MSDRGDEFRLMLKRELHYAWRPDVWRERGALERASKHARSICEHLGLRWIDVDELRREVGDGLRTDPGPIPGKERIWEIADALATLLEAAGIER